ncbi:hypothetical protein ACGFNU_21645 [Spirillospora sp. NPDC048911]|uniref:hypothetical protein n=1 Tax=Spirillospora sp. NPDC048911 TaxID=3364527 RepID=UPI0037201506
MPDPLTVEVEPMFLKPGDLVISDPDDPDRPVHWEITAVGVRHGLFVADYRTNEDVEGCHGFEEPLRLVTVVVPVESAAVA